MMDLDEAMRTTGTCRYYRPESVDPAVLREAFEVARFAPQGGNLQPVRWVVVRDVELRRSLAELYRPLWKEYAATVSGGERTLNASDTALAAAHDFADHLDQVPVLIVACARLSLLYATDAGLGRLSVVGGASIYPQVQNLCLALRARGVATALTTLLCRREPDVRQLLGIPDDVATACHIAAGYPARSWPHRLRRRPIEETVFADRFGDPL